MAFEETLRLQVVEDRVGRLLPLGDTARFRAAVREIAADDALLARLGAAAKRLSDDYSVANYARRYRDVYAECLTARSGRNAR